MGILRTITFAAAVVALTFVISGCGSESDGTPATVDGPTRTVAKPPPQKRASYLDKVTDCIEGVAFKVTPQPKGLKGYRVRSPAGRGVADLHVFTTERDSRAFYAQLVVEAVGGGKGVATFYPETKAAEKRVVGDCLTP